MPTVIALDVSLSMLRIIPYQKSDQNVTYQALAIYGINKFLDYLASDFKFEFVALVFYSDYTEVMVEFTRDYDLIRRALGNIQHHDNTNLGVLLKSICNLLISNWSTQNICQTLIFSDCGAGFGKNHMKNLHKNINVHDSTLDYTWIKYINSIKISFACIEYMSNKIFLQSTESYEQLIDIISPTCKRFFLEWPKKISDIANNDKSMFSYMDDLISRMCAENYKHFYAILKCGGYIKLESFILLWPTPLPYTGLNNEGKKVIKTLSNKLEICGFLNISDIGSPTLFSRHLIISKKESIKELKYQEKYKKDFNAVEAEKLENDIRALYSRGDGNNSDEETKSLSMPHNEASVESPCVLLHGALKVENMAALVLLNDDWFGLIYSYADGRKKSNLILNVLPPGNDIVPWLGDLRLLGTAQDAPPDETSSFPVKPEKRSYSQNAVVWIKEAGLQSDVQKLLRHAKKLPDKTLHFYKELNRIRRAALSLGFVELLDGLANIFDRELTLLPQTASPDCTIQLNHVINELRKIANRDLKISITAQPTKYNQL